MSGIIKRLSFFLDTKKEDDPLNPPGTGATAVRTAGQARREDIAAMISRFPANVPVN